MTRTPKNIELYITAAKKLGLETEMIESGSRSPLLISDGNKFTLINTKSPGFYPNVHRWNATFTGSKILSQKILNRLGYKTIKTDFVKPSSYQSQEILCKFIQEKEYTFPVLIKPNYGCDGKNIDIAANFTQLKSVVIKHYLAGIGFLIQPIVNQPEYRILVVNDSVQLVHSKANQYVTGNDTSTISELLADVKLDKKNNVFIEWQYEKLQLTPSSILADGQDFEYHLTKIPSCTYFRNENFELAMEQWAIKLAKDISSPVVGIDVFVSGSLSDPTSYTIIELNSNPAVYYLPKRCNDTTTGPRIVEKILRDYFNITE